MKISSVQKLGLSIGDIKLKVFDIDGSLVGGCQKKDQPDIAIINKDGDDLIYMVDGEFVTSKDGLPNGTTIINNITDLELEALGKRILEVFGKSKEE